MWFCEDHWEESSEKARKLSSAICGMSNILNFAPIGSHVNENEKYA